MSPWVRVAVTFFLGGFGIHRFVDHQIGMGILYLFTGGIFGIGWMIDIVRAIIAALNGGSQEAPVSPARQVSAPANWDIGSNEDRVPRLSPYEPHFVDGATRAYRYEFEFIPTNSDILDALPMTPFTRSYELTPSTAAGEVTLYLCGEPVGRTTFKADMFSDWLKRGDPMRIFLLSVDAKSEKCTAAVDFYRDRRKSDGWREQTVSALINFRGQAKQEAISFLSEGEELDFDDFDEDSNRISIECQGEAIGNLPAPLVKRHREEGITFIVFERSEVIETTDDGDDIEKPFVRIFW